MPFPGSCLLREPKLNTTSHFADEETEAQKRASELPRATQPVSTGVRATQSKLTASFLSASEPHLDRGPS